MSLLQCMATDLVSPLLRHFVVHSWEMSVSDVFLGVAGFANRGRLAPGTREGVLNVSWYEEKLFQDLDTTFF